MSPALQPSDHPKADSGYVYGRFGLAPSPQSCGLEVGLVLTAKGSQKQKEYMVKFKKTDPDKKAELKFDEVIGMEVEPGEYMVDSVAFITEEGSEYKRKPFDKFETTFQVDKGTAYYVGDYSAVTSCFSKVSRSLHYSWSMKEIDNNFDRSTADFTRKYIYFGPMEKLSATGR
jgi:hypothetical protein